MNWISVKDKLPKENEVVLVYVNSCWREAGEVKETYLAYWDTERYPEDGPEKENNWYFVPCGCCAPSFFEVLYWCPIPQRPE